MAKLHGRFRGASVFQLIYASYMRRPITNADRSQIAEAAARNNAQVGVTGMLLECDGEFIQVLEGEKRAVRRVFTRLAEDDRHANVSILSTGLIAERDFPDWSMGCFHLSAEDMPNGVFEKDGTKSRRLQDDASTRVGAFPRGFLPPQPRARHERRLCRRHAGKRASRLLTAPPNLPKSNEGPGSPPAEPRYDVRFLRTYPLVSA